MEKKKTNSLINKEFDSEPVYGGNDKCINRINSYRDKLNTNFQGEKIPKENASSNVCRL